MIELYPGNSHRIFVGGVTNEMTGAKLAAATVEVTVKETTGAGVAGITWPVLLSPAAAAGDYVDTLPSTVEFIKNRAYDVELRVVSGDSIALASSRVRARSRKLPEA